MLKVLLLQEIKIIIATKKITHNKNIKMSIKKKLNVDEKNKHINHNIKKKIKLIIQIIIKLNNSLSEWVNLTYCNFLFFL